MTGSIFPVFSGAGLRVYDKRPIRLSFDFRRFFICRNLNPVMITYPAIIGKSFMAKWFLVRRYKRYISDFQRFRCTEKLHMSWIGIDGMYDTVFFNYESM
ncbi:hypothetical protein D3C75_1031350 [compost metagenome]